MSPVEKANELVDKYYPIFDNTMSLYLAKKCASIAVDECLESTKQFIHYYTKEDDERYADVYLAMCLSVEYWNQVKQEINNI